MVGGWVLRSQTGPSLDQDLDHRKNLGLHSFALPSNVLRGD